MKENQEFDEITVALICYQEKEQLAFILEDIKKQNFLNKVKEVLLLQNPNPKGEICQKTKHIAESFKKNFLLLFYHPKRIIWA